MATMKVTEVVDRGSLRDVAEAMRMLETTRLMAARTWSKGSTGAPLTCSTGCMRLSRAVKSELGRIWCRVLLALRPARTMRRPGREEPNCS